MDFKIHTSLSHTSILHILYTCIHMMYMYTNAYYYTWSHTILPHCVQLLMRVCFWARQWHMCLPGNCMTARDWPSALSRGTYFCLCLPAEPGWWWLDTKPVTRVWPGCFGGLGSYDILVESSWTGSVLMDTSSSACEVGDSLFAAVPKPGGGVTLTCTGNIIYTLYTY